LSSSGTTYELVTPGASVRLGVPFSEFDTVFFGIGFERTDIRGDTLPNNYFLYRKNFGAVSSSVPLTVGWTRDERDSAIAPTSGYYERINLDWGVSGDTRYLRGNAQYQKYWALTKKFSFAINTELGWGKGLNGRPYPIFKNFYGGGLGTVRAFDQGSLGPVDVSGAYIGGNRRLNINAELYVPVPGAGNDRSLRLFAYVDMGNVWGEREKFSVDSLRASTGVGLSWISPVGPLKFSYGQPIRKRPEDRIQRLQFQIGTAF
jgi:outer membrane protein insertion porin family